MEFSADTLSLLRDEAYLFLCREVVEEKLCAIEEEKSRIESSRPPFGMFVRKTTRDAFTCSMRTALDNESALRDRLARIVRLEECVRPRLQRDVGIFLEVASPDFCRYRKMYAQLDAWEIGLESLPDLVTALNRDLRVVRDAFAAGRRPDDVEMSALGEIASRVENLFIQLAHGALALSEHARKLDVDGVAVPTLPNLQRVTWVNRLTVIPLATVPAEIARVEAELRAFLNGGVDLAIARIRATRESAQRHEHDFIQRYWNQLRTHARIHYVEERDLDEVLEGLTHSYGTAMAAQRLAHTTRSPFLAER
jgi:hypothetical protein